MGRPTSDRYVAAMGFSGRACQPRWAQCYGAVLVSAPQTGSARAWPKPWRRWVAGIRQAVETVNDRLLDACGLERERPHALDGLQARLAAAMGVHNVRCWLNQREGCGWRQAANFLAL